MQAAAASVQAQSDAQEEILETELAFARQEAQQALTLQLEIAAQRSASSCRHDTLMYHITSMSMEQISIKYCTLTSPPDGLILCPYFTNLSSSTEQDSRL